MLRAPLSEFFFLKYGLHFITVRVIMARGKWNDYGYYRSHRAFPPSRKRPDGLPRYIITGYRWRLCWRLPEPFVFSTAVTKSVFASGLSGEPGGRHPVAPAGPHAAAPVK